MRIARLAGVEIRINEWLILLAALYAWAGVAVYVALAFLSVAWHELGHTIAARRLGFAVKEIEFFPFGGVARLSADVNHRPRDEISVALAGPAFSFLLLLIIEGANLLGFSWGGYYEYLRIVNFTIGVFNLLPILPLDGGRVLRAFMTLKIGTMRASTIVASWGEALAIVFAFIAIAGLFWEKTGLDLPLIAGFLFLGAHKERRNGAMVFWNLLQSKEKQLQKRHTWNGEVVVARHNVPVSSLMPQISPNKCLIVTVVDERGQIVGQLSETSLLEHMMAGEKDCSVGELIKER
ncbi:site-2 protease family protein [Heliorestis convoluta]|uniref:Peptidase M50 family protein n=1 Tax=Heliorestis convoluta TaxID=356322 RepID=A0A5Q2MZ18_9FIRM|nr:site-2 protease family protein [Heliorestis convoluta]QGG47251.1 peptidase M50 family protein [Heliorestis convoluta]